MSTAPVSRNKDTLQKILMHSLLNCFGSTIAKYNLVSTESTGELEDEQDIAHIMLTVSGLQFRVLVLLHYPVGKSALHFLNLFNTDERNSKTDADIEPYYTEMGNQFCGEIKRHLYKQFYHLGMSTPSLMSRSTILTDIKNTHLLVDCHQFYLANNQIALGGSIYVFSNQKIEFEFDNASLNEVVSSGELEFF
jgi:CheY-specific phosphatase CheX